MSDFNKGKVSSVLSSVKRPALTMQPILLLCLTLAKSMSTRSKERDNKEKT